MSSNVGLEEDRCTSTVAVSIPEEHESKVQTEKRSTGEDCVGGSQEVGHLIQSPHFANTLEHGATSLLHHVDLDKREDHTTNWDEIDSAPAGLSGASNGASMVDGSDVNCVRYDWKSYGEENGHFEPPASNHLPAASDNQYHHHQSTDLNESQTSFKSQSKRASTGVADSVTTNEHSSSACWDNSSLQGRHTEEDRDLNNSSGDFDSPAQSHLSGNSGLFSTTRLCLNLPILQNTRDILTADSSILAEGAHPSVFHTATDDPFGPNNIPSDSPSCLDSQDLSSEEVHSDNEDRQSDIEDEAQASEMNRRFVEVQVSAEAQLNENGQYMYNENGQTHDETELFEHHESSDESEDEELIYGQQEDHEEQEVDQNNQGEGQNDLEGDEAPVLHDSTLSKLGIIVSRPKHADYRMKHERLASFETWPDGHPVGKEDLAGAGFFFKGANDIVTCFYCGGTLHGWNKTDEPWVEHCRYFPKCGFIRMLLGQDFIQTVQAMHEQKIVEISKEDVLERLGPEIVELYNLDFLLGSHQLRKDPAVTTLVEHGYDEDKVVKAATMLGKSGTTVTSERLQYMVTNAEQFDSNQELIGAAADFKMAAENKDFADKAEGIREDIASMRNQLTCKVCMDKPVEIVFLTCGHLVTCLECACALDTCPVCRAEVKAIARAYTQFPTLR